MSGRDVCGKPFRMQVMVGPMPEPWTKSMVPDFNDPATLGCLMAAVRQAWGDPGAVATREEGTPVRWKVQTAGPWAGPGTQVGYGATEAEALIAALEAVVKTQKEGGEDRDRLISQ
jgi:hypothetical protein